jgi:hypothetical protein
VKHIASGHVHPLYLAFPRDGKLALGRGGVLAFYELDAKERLTDAQWRQTLMKERPARPEWTRSLVSEDPKKKVSLYSELEGD